MRRTIFLAALTALLLASPAPAANTVQILRDCIDDGVLQGKYTLAELRTARGAIPADVDEYSDCRDVISRAVAAATATSKSSSAGGSGSPAGGGGGGGSSSGGGGAEPVEGGGAEPVPLAAVDPGVEVSADTPQDAEAVVSALTGGGSPVSVSDRDISPLLSAQIGRNGLPGGLVAALALLGCAAVAGAVARIRSRGAARP